MGVADVKADGDVDSETRGNRRAINGGRYMALCEDGKASNGNVNGKVPHVIVGELADEAR